MTLIRTFQVATATIAMLICHSTVADDMARVFVAEKGHHVAFLLPVTHNGSSVETHGAYLDTVIRPVFGRSTRVYFEGSLPMSGALISSCPNGDFVDSELDEKLNRRFLEVTEGSSFWDKQPVKAMVGRFTKIHQYFSHSLLSVPPGLSPNMWPGLPVHAMLQDDFHLPGSSIEKTDDLFATYCAMDSDDRQMFVRALVAPTEAKENKNGPDNTAERDDKALSQKYLEWLSLAVAELNGRRIDNPDHERDRDWMFEAYNKFVLTARNRLWITKMNAIANSDETPFYALGVGHFYSTKHTKGLIQLLREEGYSVALVKDRAELDTISAKHGLRERPSYRQKKGDLFVPTCLEKNGAHVSLFGVNPFTKYTPSPTGQLERAIEKSTLVLLENTETLPRDGRIVPEKEEPAIKPAQLFLNPPPDSTSATASASLQDHAHRPNRNTLYRLSELVDRQAVDALSKLFGVDISPDAVLRGDRLAQLPDIIIAKKLEIKGFPKTDLFAQISGNYNAESMAYSFAQDTGVPVHGIESTDERYESALSAFDALKDEIKAALECTEMMLCPERYHGLRAINAQGGVESTETAYGKVMQSPGFSRYTLPERNERQFKKIVSFLRAGTKAQVIVNEERVGGPAGLTAKFEKEGFVRAQCTE